MTDRESDGLGAAPFGFKGAGFSSLRNPLRRVYGQGDLHFVTFSCYRRLPLLGAPRDRNLFVEILDEMRARHAFRVLGYVVMPEHVHILLSEPPKGNPSRIMQALKQRVSSDLHEGERRAKPFWQRRFYDFNVWSYGKVKEKLEYMHANPVKRGLVGHPREWAWSSWSFYAKGEEGLIRIDTLEELPPQEKPAPLKPKGAAPTVYRAERKGG